MRNEHISHCANGSNAVLVVSNTSHFLSVLGAVEICLFSAVVFSLYCIRAPSALHHFQEQLRTPSPLSQCPSHTWPTTIRKRRPWCGS